MFRAFSDRTRLRLLNLLRAGETCVCDLVEVLGVAQRDDPPVTPPAVATS